MNIHLLVVSGGKGMRFGGQVPKQYVRSANGELIIYKSIKPFLSLKNSIKSLTIVCDPQWLGFVRKIDFGLNCPTYYANAGKTREESIYNGLLEIRKLANVDNNSYLVLQEAVRAFVSKKVITNLLAADATFACVSPVVRPIVLFGEFQESSQTVSRLLPKSDMIELQLPRRYDFKVFLELMDDYFRGGPPDHLISDEAQLFLNAGHKINAVAGEFDNIKITFPLHAQILHAIEESRKDEKQ